MSTLRSHPRTGSRRAAALAAALAAGLLLAGAGPAGAIETEQFGFQPYPLFEGNHVRRSFEVALDPGGSSTDSIRLWNKTRKPVEIRLYGAAVNVIEGRYEVAPYESRGQGSGAWVVPERDTVRLGPGQEAVVPFTVHVPPVLTEGQRTVALVAESDTGLSSGGVDVVARLAMLVNLRPDGSILGGLSWWIIVAAALALAAAVAGLILRRRARASISS